MNLYRVLFTDLNNFSFIIMTFKSLFKVKQVSIYRLINRPFDTVTYRSLLPDLKNFEIDH